MLEEIFKLRSRSVIYNQDTCGGEMSNTMELPPLQAEKDTSASDVLTNTDLLGKILQCLGCRSCLIAAALTSKHWLRTASRLFVPDFCARHQPRLLGVYVSSVGISGSEFIPLLQSEVLNHADFGFGNLPEPNVWDCRNGCVLFEFGGETFHHAGLAVRSPLLYPNMDRAVVLPMPPQPPCYSEYPHAMLLSTDHGEDALCYRVSIRICNWESDKKVTAFVCALRSGSWSVSSIAVGSLDKSPIQILPTSTVLIDSKIYMATQAGYILGLKLDRGEFFIVEPPEGVEPDQYPGKLFHCRGDDFILYLFHVDEDKSLNVWLRRMNDDHGHGRAGTGGGANGWVLRETISLRETCGHLVEQLWETATDQDEDTGAGTVVGAGDNAEFVFLELGITGVIVYMHLKTREVKQVYQREPDDDFLISVRPFMFIRPPVFPVQDAHEGEVAVLQE